MRTTAVVLMGLSLGSFHASAAQSRLTLPPPTRIRYSLPSSGEAVVATVLVQRGDSLWVRPQATGDSVPVLLPALSRLEVSLGQDGHGLRGAGVGFLIGGVGGAVYGFASPEDCSEPGQFYCYKLTRGQSALVGAGVFGLLGAGVGALVGVTQRTDRWEPVLLANRATTHLVSSVRTYKAGIRIRAF